MRAGQALAWPNVACHGDVFHGVRELGQLALFLERRAAGATSAREAIEIKMEKAKKRSKGNTLSKRLTYARADESRLIQLSQDVRTLSDCIGPAYLDLLRFFLNHRTFMRSEHPERVGKSPAELLKGQKHPHWLQMLGFTPFSREAL